jgi:hypothetical protein
MSEWKPFDTAPDTFILAWCPLREGMMEDGEFNPTIGRMMVGFPIFPKKRRTTSHGVRNNFKLGFDGRGRQFYATHWMPIPERPATDDVRAALKGEKDD